MTEETIEDKVRADYSNNQTNDSYDREYILTRETAFNYVNNLFDYFDDFITAFSLKEFLENKLSEFGIIENDKNTIIEEAVDYYLTKLPIC